MSWNSPSEQIRNQWTNVEQQVSGPSRSPHCAEGPEGQKGGQGDNEEVDDLEPFVQEHLAQLHQLKFADSTQAASMGSKINIGV